MESVLRSIMKYAMLDFFKVTVSQILRQSHLLEVGLTQIPEDHETLSIVRHAWLHANISSMKSSLGL